jgi:hypothetical protein
MDDIFKISWFNRGEKPATLHEAEKRGRDGERLRNHFPLSKT